MEEPSEMALKTGHEFFITNQDSANILSRTDHHSDNLYVWDFVGFKITRFTDFRMPALAAAADQL